eukprot:3940406-Rhodomonas_salina.3
MVLHACGLGGRATTGYSAKRVGSVSTSEEKASTSGGMVLRVQEIGTSVRYGATRRHHTHVTLLHLRQDPSIDLCRSSIPRSVPDIAYGMGSGLAYVSTGHGIGLVFCGTRQGMQGTDIAHDALRSR